MDRFVHIQSLPNTTKDLRKVVPLEEYSWRLEGSSWVTESRTFYLVSDAGEYILFHVGYTNAGWPVPPACQATACYFDPRRANHPVNGWLSIPPPKSRGIFRSKKTDEGLVRETAHYPATKMSISKSKTSLEVEQYEVVLQVDDCREKRRGFNLKYAGKTVTFELFFEPLTEAVTFGDGRILFGAEQNDGLIHMKFIPSGKVSGSLTMNGVCKPFNGRGMGVHQFQGIRPTLVATRWTMSMFCSRDQQLSLFMIQVMTPPTYGNAVVNYGGFVDATGLHVCRDGKITPFKPQLDPDSNYYIPHELLYEWHGETGRDEKFTAECRVKPRMLCERINLLDNLPFEMRKVMESFITKPYIYQWVDACRVTLKIGETTAEHDGWMVQEIAILNEEA